MTLEQIISATAHDPGQVDLFHNAAQMWNRNQFWRSMRSNGGRTMPDHLRRMIDKDFGGLDELRRMLHDGSVEQFGSGWAWLAFGGAKMFVTATSNADNPLVHDATALLAIDVWEHAYYLAYQNRRNEFVDTFLDNPVNWEHDAEWLDAVVAHRIGTKHARSKQRQA